MLRRSLLLLAVAVVALAPAASAGAHPKVEPARAEAAASQAMEAGDDAADPGAGSTTSTSRDLPGTTLEAANEGDGGAAAPWLIGAGIAAALAIAVGGYLLKRRMG